MEGKNLIWIIVFQLIPVVMQIMQIIRELADRIIYSKKIIPELRRKVIVSPPVANEIFLENFQTFRNDNRYNNKVDK